MKSYLPIAVKTLLNLILHNTNDNILFSNFMANLHFTFILIRFVNCKYFISPFQQNFLFKKLLKIMAEVVLKIAF